MSQGLCPSCGAAVNLTAGQAKTKCQYCDTPVTFQQAQEQFSEFKNSKVCSILIIAETAQEGGSYDEALRLYQKAVEQDPTSSEVWFNKAICSFLSSRNDEMTRREAVGSWKAAIKFANDSDAMSRRIVKKLLEIKDSNPERALDCFSMILKDLRLKNPNASTGEGDFLDTDDISDDDQLGSTEITDLSLDLPPAVVELIRKGEDHKIAAIKELRSQRPDMDLAEAKRIVEEAGEELGTMTASKSGCFIATACYGNYDHPIVMELRHFRDDSLETSRAGRLFIKRYYKLSPPCANLVAKSEILKQTVRVLIVIPMVRVARLIKKRNTNGISEMFEQNKNV